MAEGDRLFARFGQSYPAGTVLFREGEEGSTMYVLQQGKIRIFKQTQDSEKTLAVLGAGEFFGEMAILNEKPRTASAEVLEDSRVLVIDARTFEAMVTGNTEIAVRLIKKLSRRLAAADALIEILMSRDPKARVILGLVREAEFNGHQASDGALLVPLDRSGLARQVGLTAAEVSSVLARLSRLSIVDETEEGFRVPDLMRLYEFLEFLQMQQRGGTS